MAPAEIKKEGSVFDLAIAVGILTSIGGVQNSQIDKYAFLGELSLDGKVNSISGILPMCIELNRLGIKKVILPKSSAIEASIVKGLEVYGVENLREAVDFLNGDIQIEKSETDIEKIMNHPQNTLIDFDEVKGQENVKRAMEIAAAGGHNCLLIRKPRFRKNNDCKKNNNNSARYEF